MRERDYAASLTRMSAHARVEEILSEGAADGIPSARGRDYTLAADCVRVMQAIAEGKLIEIQDTGHSHAYRRFIVRTDNGLFEHDADPLTAALKALEAPAPRECVLSDGSVVTVHDGMFKWYGSTVGHLTTRNWRDLADTGADFDALKQFAERAK
jgi:hypothetical protein